jgi:gamma-glutamylcyclotransferase (GGCT)/AIG2-like uncharacterized protein YtfP
MRKHLFAYGTLMCQEIMVQVTGFPFRGVRGILRDYHRGIIRGEVYPGIIPRKGGVVEGLVYRDLPEEAWKRLDAFEGEMYHRTAVAIELENGIGQAQTYVVRPEFEHRVGPSLWSFEEFLKSNKAFFESRYPGYHTLKEGSSSKADAGDDG